MCVLGHVGQILRSYLHDLCDHGIQACYHGGRGLRIKNLLRALFGCFSARIHRVAFSTSRESLPTGVKHRVYYLVFATDDEVDFYSCIGADIFIFIGCATSAPNGSSPRGYSQIFYSSIGSEFSSSSILQCNLYNIFHLLLLICASIFFLN
jgi:hypothetical protein